MTQTQLNWMQDNGYDPEQYDMDLNGNVLKRQAVVAEEDQREVMSMPRAFGTSFLGNLLPSAAGLYAGAQTGALGGSMFGLPGTVIGGIGGGLLGGYGAGKLQEKALEEFAPGAAEEMARAQTDQPVASYLGGFAPNALTMRPSVKGLSGLLRPTVRGKETLRAALSNPNFIAPAANVAANVGASTAGQLINVAEGGEFSAPRFAADVALGTLFNKPTGLGKRLGFQDTPDNIQEAPGNLAKARDRAEFMANVPKDFVTPRAERGAQDIVKPGVNIGLEAPDQYFTAEGKPLTEKAYAADYSKWWKSETEPTTEFLQSKADEVKAQIPKDRLKELSNDPEVGEVLRDPSKMEAFVAKQADQTLEDVFQMMERRKGVGQFATAEEAANQKALQELRAERGLPNETALSDVEAAYAARERTANVRAKELYGPELTGISGRPPSVSKASEGYQLIRPPEPPRSALEAGREVYSAKLEGSSGRPPSLGAVANADKTAYEAYSGQQPAPEVVKNATDAAREIYTRLQRPIEEGPARKISQEDINLATELANRRGLKVQLDRAFAGSQEVRGMYLIDKNTGDRIIRINPLMATADTAIHEIGHDIFKGVTNKGMRRSLMDTALDSPAYKAELAARAEEVKAGKITEQGARDIALEEGLIQAFGEKMPDINRGELRAWFSAFKASMKQLVTGKMSPEDALAWMHYATTENVPWKGMAVAKTGDVGGEERLQRALENDSAYLKAVESGDMETAQRMVNEAAKAAGYNEGPLYHVGKSSWTEADRPVYTQDSKELADKFLKSLRRDYPEAQAKKLYAQMENPAVQGRDIERSSFLTSSELGKEQLAEAMGKGFDSVKGYYAGLGVPEYLTTKPNQIKLADPVTYDNAGNVIPLSERFNKQSSDTRYQRPQQETPEFKNWFGESKVVDADGKPLTVYHGTAYGKFSERADSINATRQDMLQARAKSYANYNAANDLLTETQKKYGRFSRNPESLQARELYESAYKDLESAKRNIPYEEEPGDVFRYVQAQDRGYLGAGFYFTANKNVATGYSETSYRTRVAGEEKTPYVYETYLSIKNPYTGNEPIVSPKTDANAEYRLKGIRDIDERQREQGRITRERLIESGFDGVIRDYGEGIEYVAFYPEQIKSATENRGTFDPLNKDIRYQRPIVGKAKDMAQETLNRISKFAEVDNLESRGGIHAVVAKGMRAFYATRSFMEGKPKAFEKAIYALSPERQVMLGEHIGQEFDQRRFIKPSNEIAEAYNEYRQQWQKFWPSENNQAGHTVRTAGGQRARLTDPYYGPFHMWSDNVRDIMTTKQGSPEYVKLQDDYIKQHVQAHQQNGVPLQEAQTRAAAEFSEEVRALSVPYDPTAAGTFAGARKAQGIPLPHSWREYNIAKLIKSYDRRSAIDFAMQEHMEKSPEIMAALGSKTFFNDQPIPAQIKAAIPDISTDKSVQSILREMSGQPAFKPDSVGAGASRGIGALTIGTVSKATEIPTTMIAGLRYLQVSDYLPGTMKFIEKLADWSALQERSYASGLNKRDASQNMRQVSGVAENAAGFLNKFAEGVSSVTGLNQLEKAARTLAQGWGEVLVQINKNKAATGDKDAVRMLDTLSPDWRTRSDADLAAQFGKLMQGSYDMTQLPAWMLESGAAPYLTWSKWSAGQYSNFVKFAIEPAMQGNVKPLIGHLLIGVMGGAAVDQIREWMNNREGRDVNWSELESWMQQNQGQLGAEGMKQLSVKLLNIMQGVGTFGIAGDIAKMVTTAAVGGTAQGMATAPVANAVFDTSKKVAAALKAIDDGEDFGLVLRQAMGDIAQTHIQVARVGRNWLDEQENLRYDDRRQRRLFDELTGAPTQAGTFSVNYGNLAERAFERGNITEKTGEEAFNLVSRARQEATSGEDYASRIRKLKTSQNQIMPSLERQPQKAARYLSFVEGAEPGKGGETLKRYYTRQNEDKYRKSLIEGMSGIR